MKLASDIIRKTDILKLRRLLDPETGRVLESAFIREQRLYEKSIRKKSLDCRIRTCRQCPGLNETGTTECACGWGNLDARIMFIGQSLHEPGVISGLPFILGSGMLIDISLRLVGLRRMDVFFTNAIHCHPAKNRASTPEEITNCVGFLSTEIDIVHPELLLCLGNDAMGSVESIRSNVGIPAGIIIVKLKHPAAVLRGAPEASKDWVLRLTREIRRVL